MPDPNPEKLPVAKRVGGRWYYSVAGGRRGPVSDKELKTLADRGELRPGDLVWKEGQTEWRPAKKVGGLFPGEPAEMPPLPEVAPGSTSEPTQPVSDIWAWLLVAVPIIGAVVELFMRHQLLFAYWLLNTFFGFSDVRAIKATGRPAPSGWWVVFFVPVYLWKRATLLRQTRLHFGLWVGAFVASLVITLGFDRSGLEESAKPLVTQIVQEQLGGRARCIGVRVTESVGGGYYKAIATLDNGNDIPILIEAKGNMIYVTIPR